MLPPPDAKWNKGGEPLNLYWPRFVKGNADDKCGLCPICAEPKERGGEGEQKWLKVRLLPPLSFLIDLADALALSSLQLKNSSYVYHMSYTHGLSNLTGASSSSLPPSPVLTLARLARLTLSAPAHRSALLAAGRDAHRHVAAEHQGPARADGRGQVSQGASLAHALALSAPSPKLVSLTPISLLQCNDWVKLLSVKNIDAIVPELIWWKVRLALSSLSFPSRRPSPLLS